MYKAKLYEMCQKRAWGPPEYAVTRDGLDHNPRFSASVKVNGVSFDAADPSKSSKEAQNKAAQVAVELLDAVDPPAKPPSSTPIDFPPKSATQTLGADTQISYKRELQTYTQKKRFNLPNYDVVREGYAHDPRFKASVSVDGKTYYSQQFFSTVKEAETDAAKVAFLSLSDILLDEPSFYKNFLQQLAQKEGLLLPTYITKSDGASHMPIFSSTVEVGGESFAGDSGRTKKQAEMNAAKVAWCELRKRLDASSVTAGLPLSGSVEERLELPPSGSNLDPSKSTPVPVSHARKDISESLDKSEEGVKNESSTICKTPTQHKDQGRHPNEVVVNGNGQTDDPEVTLRSLGVEIIDDISFENDSSTYSAQSASTTADVGSESPIDGCTSSLMCNRVRVYPGKPNMVLPKGAYLLPFSDDMWTAVSLDFPDHDGEISD